MEMMNQLRELKVLGDRLRWARAGVNLPIEQLEKFLEEAALGVEAWLENVIEVNARTDPGLITWRDAAAWFSLGYAVVEGRWRVATRVTASSGLVLRVSMDDVAPLASAPLVVRAAAPSHFPALLDALKAEAERHLALVNGSSSEVP